MEMVKVEVLAGFCTDDRCKVLNASKGDVITISEGTAVRLAGMGLVKKYRKTAKKRGK